MKKTEPKLNRFQEQAQTYEKEIVRQQVKIAELEALLQYLHTELSKQRSSREQVKGLYRNLDETIMQTLDKRGYSRKQSAKAVKFQPINTQGKNTSELIAAARTYDAQKYFQYRELRQGMKLHYRLASKFYRTTRNISKESVKSAYRLAKRGGK